MQLEGFEEISGILRCAVYALVWRREVVYVGKSRQPWVRLYSHANARRAMRPVAEGYRTVRQGIKFDQVFIRSCMLGELDSLELEMIRKYQPRYNIKGIPPAPPGHLDQLIASLVCAPPPCDQPRIYRRF